MLENIKTMFSADHEVATAEKFAAFQDKIPSLVFLWYTLKKDIGQGLLKEMVSTHRFSQIESSDGA